MRSFSRFEDFWPFYVGEHRDPRNRLLHFIGITGVLICIVVSLFWSWYAILACPLIGYGFAWVGHFVFERNTPATFQYPTWSLRGDFRMYRLILLGRMRSEVERATQAPPQVPGGSP